MEYQQQLDKLAGEGRFRELRPLSHRNGSHIDCDGITMLNLSSNDYLGLAGDERLHRKFYGKMDRDCLDLYGLGSASSRLLAGDSQLAHQLERALREAYGKEASLLFNSGYHANIGILPALLNKGDIIFSDKLNHASITDGLRLSDAAHKRYRHLDYDHLAKLLAQYRYRYKRAVIVSESVFSMDGDVADLGRLADLKKQFDCLLYIDEAHAIGLYGENGLGESEAQRQVGNIDLLVGTFGKALASVGAFVLCTETVRNYLVNYSRSLIFTTALPPVVLHWNLFAFQEMLAYRQQRRHLAEISNNLRSALRDAGLQTDGSTNIVPVIIGNNSLTVLLAEKMRHLGYFILPVRPPTVPEGTARFRLSLTANMAWQELVDLPGLIARAFAEV
jgi:8-amino-7-oxononanoate synthase